MSLRAIVIATGETRELGMLNQRYPTPMIPFIDRPFLQHIVEYLVLNGITHFDFILSRLPETIENYFGEGARWGCKFRYHLAKNSENPYGLIRTFQLDDDTQPFLLVHADRLPIIQLGSTEPENRRIKPILYTWYGTHDQSNENADCDIVTENGTQRWTGWAWLYKNLMPDTLHSMNEAQLYDHLMTTMDGEHVYHTVSKMLCVRTFGGILCSQKSVLDKEFTGLLFGGREVQEGVWLSRNIMLHPTASISAPVYIGENCRIGPGTKLGPHVIIGNDCVLDTKCTVNNSVVLPGSYVGEGLELVDVIIDKNCLVNVKVGAAISIGEEFLLGSMSGKFVWPFLMRMFSRCTALLLLLILWPLLLITAIVLKIRREGTVLHKYPMVKLPTGNDPMLWRTFNQRRFSSRPMEDSTAQKFSSSYAHSSSWQDFFLRYLPGLINVVKGEMGFVGVPPRTRQEVLQLPDDWRELYLRAKTGLVTEANIIYGAHPNGDEMYSSEAFYSVASKFGHDLKLQLKYFAKLLGYYNKLGFE